MKIPKLNTVHQFAQSPWLAKYKNYYAEQRVKPKKGDFGFRFHKIMNKTFYEKSVELWINVKNLT